MLPNLPTKFIFNHFFSFFSRRTPSLSPEPQRAGSAPRQQGRDRPRSPKRASPEIVSKSKSLPPSKAGEAKNNKKVLSEEEKAQIAAEEKMKVIYCTVWKLQNFSVTEFLREINFWDCRSSKTAILTNFKCPEF